MKIYSLLILCAIVPTVFAADDLFTENSELIKKLAEQQKELDPLFQKNSRRKLQVQSLKTTNELLSGKRKTPPSGAQEKWTVVQTFFTDSEFAADRKTEGEKGTFRFERWIPVEGGVRYRFSAEFRAWDASAGILKFGLMVNRPNNKTLWPDADLGKGTFLWKKASFEYTMPIDQKSILLIAGLQGSKTGKVTVRNIVVEKINP